MVKEGHSELIAVEGAGTKSGEGNRIMGRPYSLDLRERVIQACEAGEESQAAIARRFQVSENTVSCWSRLAREEGRREPKAHGRGFPSVLAEADGAVLKALVAQRNDATLEEYAQAFTARTGEAISGSSRCRGLQRHGLVVKKRHSGRVSRIGPMSPKNATSMAEISH